jgi:MinD-like ATPase involved in chromosome partitioning or flagellar assembly
MTDGRIITFYSYKGGTGRSMALANVAWILASAGKRVLMVDWDLEAPGLHRYFRPFLIDPELEASDGVIDFVLQFGTQAAKPSVTQPDSAWIEQNADILKYRISLEWDFPREGTLDLIPAGRQDDTYATRVSTFNWQSFYDRLGGGHAIEAAARTLRRNYDYILIDSRTGVSDTAGICTVQLPDVLVACFTYNNQSTEGAAAVAASVYKQRVLDRGDRRFRLYPVPMRVDQYEQRKLKKRQAYARQLFSSMLNVSDMTHYWANIEVPAIPAYAYEEVLATFHDEVGDPKTILRPMIAIARYLSDGDVNSFELLISARERSQVLADYAATTDGEMEQLTVPLETLGQAATRRAERTFLELDREAQSEARKLWLRFIRLGEGTGSIWLARLTSHEATDISDAVIDAFVDAGVIERTEEGHLEAEEALGQEWPRIRTWATESADFLEWRRRFRALMQDWTDAGRPSELLLQGRQLVLAQEHRNAAADLTELEAMYLRVSEQVARNRAKRTRRLVSAAAAALVVLAAAGVWFNRYIVQQRELEQKLAKATRILEAAGASRDPLEAVLLCRELEGLPQPDGGLATVKRIASLPVPLTVVTGRNTPRAIRFRADDQTVAILMESSTLSALLELRDVATGAVLLDEKPPAMSAEFTPDDKLLVSTTSDVASYRLSRRGNRAMLDRQTILHRSRERIAHATQRSDGKLLVLTSPPDVLTLIERHKEVMKVPVTDASRYHMSSSGMLYVEMYVNDGFDLDERSHQNVIVWRDGDVKAREVGFPEATELKDAVTSADGSTWAVATDRGVYVVSNDSRRLSIPQSDIQGISLSANGRLVAANSGRVVRIWDTQTDTEVISLRPTDSSIRFVVLSASGRTLAAATEEQVQFWRLGDLSQIPTEWHSFPTFFRKVTSACLTPTQRLQLLGETRSVAQTKWLACEQSYGRTGRENEGNDFESGATF